VAQNFTLAAGVNFNEQAVRTEVVSFSLSLKELGGWKERSDTKLNVAADGTDRFCEPQWKRGMVGHLGLKEWVDSALFPVKKPKRILQAGIHPAPNIAKPNSPPSFAAPPRPPSADLSGFRGRSLDPETYRRLLDQISVAINAINDYKAVIDAAEKTGKEADAELTRVNLAGAISAFNNAVKPYEDIQSEELASTVGKVRRLQREMRDYMDTDLENVRTAIVGIVTPKNDADKAKTSFEAAGADAQVQRGAHLAAKGAEVVARKYRDLAVESAAHAQLVAKFVGDVAKGLSQFRPDPPIDSLLHQVQFVVSYGANITPSWTLINWKGPGFSGNLAAASGVRTHLLQIGLGPPAGVGTASSDALRLIQNQSFLSRFGQGL
jgi:hypothetical protein